MENSAFRSPASFGTQADALLRKNLTFQKRNTKSNTCLILIPFLLCSLLIILQTLINNQLDKPENKCGCVCLPHHANGSDTNEAPCQNVCGIQYSTISQGRFCPIPNPQPWPALLQIPAPQSRARQVDSFPSNDFPNKSCRNSRTCPVTMLFTGNNQSFGKSLVQRMFPRSESSLIEFNSMSDYLLGSDRKTDSRMVFEPAFNRPIYNIQQQCSPNSTFSVPIQAYSTTTQLEIRCARAQGLWRNSSSEINNALYKGYWKGNPARDTNEISTAYDFLNSNGKNFNVTVWYNSTFAEFTNNRPVKMVRVPRSVNLVSNVFLQLFKGPGTKMLIDFIKEMPKQGTQLRLDISSLIGTLFFAWVILLLFPVMLGSLVYEKQQNLRIMMKMHGLGDGPYWMISYSYFLFMSLIYMFCFVLFGSVIGLKFFTLNSYAIQFVLYFIFINLQISVAFLVSAMFSDFKTATVVAYISVFGTGLLGAFLFQFFLEDATFPRHWIIVMELYPGFSLYRGLFEFGQYSFNASFLGTKGMLWGNLNDQGNGMKEVFVIMVVEWFVFLVAAYYIDQVISPGTGIRRSSLFFLDIFRKKSPSSSSSNIHNLKDQVSEVSAEGKKADVEQEREKVEQFIKNPNPNLSIVAYDLKKVYPGRDGNPDKFAVRGLSLAIPKGECFGMLGPNGAGKTSFINMMIGLTKPTSGTAIVQDMDIRTQMDFIYTSMGVCPQHDLLWETLTGEEHLLFYGRLKNLKGQALLQAVEESLKSVNLFHGGVKNKPAGKYSGGMKRRLSVAISLIGDPKVVYMDEPSTGLDPASRNNLWNVVKRAKQDRAIILTTHSMEEAEVLCDRLGIFVDGSLQCVGNPKELKARYGGSYILTMTTAADHEDEVQKLAESLSPNASKIYQISGTQKFELPKHEVRIADVFWAVGNAKSKFTVQGWGITDTTLEDVFIKVACTSETFNVFA